MLSPFIKGFNPVFVDISFLILGMLVHSHHVGRIDLDDHVQGLEPLVLYQVTDAGGSRFHLLTFADDFQATWEYGLTAFATLTPKHIDGSDLVPVIGPSLHNQADLSTSLNHVTDLDLTFPVVSLSVCEDRI